MASSHKRHARRGPQRSSTWRTLRLAGIICFLAFAVVAFGAALLQTSSITFGKKSGDSTDCTQLRSIVTDPNDPSGTVVWVKVKSSTAAEVMAAVRCTPMFQNASVGDDLIARAMRTGRLADPALVKAYRHDAGLADIWVVPVVDQNNLPLAMLAFDYDEGARQLRAGEFAAVSGNMFYVTHTFPAISSTVAASAVSTQQHISIARSNGAELIYFPADSDSLVSGQQKWQGGGTSFLDPIWRVAGADSKWHYVDHNGQAHLSTDLPVESNYPAMPASVTVQ